MQPPSLFDSIPGPRSAAAASPLADRLRPRRLEEMVGQRQILGEDGFLARAIAMDRIPSMILWGPPGCGKTTLAQLIAAHTAMRFVPFSAVTSGIKEVKEVMGQAARWRRSQGSGTLLFVDEIHRFNRAQQDAFLPYVESGEIILVGATTENPSFELNSALLSRCRVVVLEPLDLEDVQEVLRRALTNEEHGLGGQAPAVADDALQALAQLASGDARRALNLLELVVDDAREAGRATVDTERVHAVSQRKVLVYDKAGEEHFNLISAFHKSLRESDPDAAVYWLARMLEAGEGPLYLARRLVRFASEDIGLADPVALARALEAWEAYRRLGSPEGELALVGATVYLALAPKSNALYRAWNEVRRAVQELPAEPVPVSLRNAPTSLMKEIGYGRGYVYAPDAEAGIGGLQCLPPAVAGRHFYRPGGNGFEEELQQRLRDLDKLRKELRSAEDGG